LAAEQPHELGLDGFTDEDRPLGQLQLDLHLVAGRDRVDI